MAVVVSGVTGADRRPGSPRENDELLVVGMGVLMVEFEGPWDRMEVEKITSFRFFFLKTARLDLFFCIQVHN